MVMEAERTVLVAGTPPPGATAEPVEGIDVAGRAGALTTVTPLRWWGVLLLRPLLWVAGRTGLTTGLLRKLAFIDYARWALVKTFPSNGAPQGRDPRRHHHIFFESNFNGTWDQYLDAFAYVVDRRFWLFWGSSYKFPARLPTKPFRDWIRDHNTQAGYFYSAYPDASATIVVSALDLQKELEGFARRTEGLDAAAFRRAWDDLLTSLQEDL